MHPGGYSRGGGVRPASQNPYSIYDQNLRFYLTCLWRNQNFNVLFMTVMAGTVALNIFLWRALVDEVIGTDEKVASLKKHPVWGNSSKMVPYHWPRRLKNVTILFESALTYISHIRKYSRVMHVNFTVSAGMLLSSENRSSSLVNSGVSRCFCVYVEIGDMKEAMLGGGGV